jgi:class 3 adenylate cyclase
VAVWWLHLAIPVLGLWLLLARPALDVAWQHHPSHFWLVVSAAGGSVWLGLRMQGQARERRDARLLLVGFAFTAAAGFLLLHALATPGILVGPNLGFELATPLGLFLASLPLGLSALQLADSTANRIVVNELRIRAVMLGSMVLWAVVTLTGTGPLGGVPEADTVRTLVVPGAIVSVLLYAAAAVGYFRVHRRRPSVMLVGLITASSLLAEAMVAMVFARNWQLSWWLWHVLMAAAFGFFTYSAYVQYRREGSAAGLFNAITTERTVSQIRSEYANALESLTSALQRSEQELLTEDQLQLITQGLAARFGLTEGQTEVLRRAADALSSERAQGRRLRALAEIGAVGRVRQDESNLLERLFEIVQGGFSGDLVRFGLITDGRLSFPAALSAPAWGAGSVLAVPLTVAGSEVGVIEMMRAGGGFDDRDRFIVETLGAEVSIALENLRLYGQLEGLFRRYMSPAVASALLADPEQAKLGGAVVEITSLFADLRGFTAFSERSSPEDVVRVLNLYFGLVVPRLLDAGGTVVQFIGDALLAVFNAPARQHDHAYRACLAGLAIQEVIGTVVSENPGWPLFRVGVNTGPALVGNIGSDEVRSFSVMGDAVNVAARLEGLAAPGTVVIGRSTLAAAEDLVDVVPMGPQDLKGKEQPVEAFRLLGLRQH